jgi:hypothetical protein
MDPYPAPAKRFLHIDAERCSPCLQDAYGRVFLSRVRLCAHEKVATLVVGQSQKTYIHYGRLNWKALDGQLKYCSLTGSDIRAVTLSCYEAPAQRDQDGRPAMFTAYFELGHVWIGVWDVRLSTPLSDRSWEAGWIVPVWDTQCDELDMSNRDMQFKTKERVTDVWSVSLPNWDMNSFTAKRRNEDGQSVEVDFVVDVDDFYHITLEARTATLMSHPIGAGYSRLYKKTVKYVLLRKK